jgi:hypothetical protein
MSISSPSRFRITPATVSTFPPPKSNTASPVSLAPKSAITCATLRTPDHSRSLPPRPATRPLPLRPPSKFLASKA